MSEGGTMTRKSTVVKRLLHGALMLGWIPTLAVASGMTWMDGSARAAAAPTPVKVTRLYTGPGPGHILLAEDTTGQGHISRALKGDRIALDIGLADGATLPR
jgi:hypothetical protein